VGVVIWRALPSDASTLTRVAHATKRHWKYPEDWIRLWRDALTVTPGFVARHPVWCVIRGASMLGFYALSGEGRCASSSISGCCPHTSGVASGLGFSTTPSSRSGQKALACYASHPTSMPRGSISRWARAAWARSRRRRVGGRCRCW
jgi:hypothetical protein